MFVTELHVLCLNILFYFQLMSALKAGEVSSSRFARAVEMNEKKHAIPVNRSGGGV